MTIATFPTTDPDQDGIRWWASADVHSVLRGNTFSVFTGKMFPCPPHGHVASRKTAIKVWASKEGTLGDCELYVKRSKEARNLAKSFKDVLSESKLDFVQPCISHIDKISSVLPVSVWSKRVKRIPLRNEYVLLEPTISGKLDRFQTENNKDGASSGKTKILDAFSHFTYCKSQGEFVVCEFKGVLDGSIFRLSCPKIHSRNKRFGDTDDAEFGIQNFFSRHVCNSICETWRGFNSSAVSQDEDFETDLKEVPDLNSGAENIRGRLQANQRGDLQIPTASNSAPVSASSGENMSIGTNTPVSPSAPSLELMENPTLEMADAQTCTLPVGLPSYSEVMPSTRTENGEFPAERPPPYTELTPPPLYTESAEPFGMNQRKKHKYAQTQTDNEPDSAGLNKFQKKSSDHLMVTQKSCNF